MAAIVLFSLWVYFIVTTFLNWPDTVGSSVVFLLFSSLPFFSYLALKVTNCMPLFSFLFGFWRFWAAIIFILVHFPSVFVSITDPIQF